MKAELKIKKVGEERYFRTERELIRFIEKMEGMSCNDMCAMYSRLTECKPEVGRNWWEMHMNLNRDFLIMGKFIVRVFRGCYSRTSGDYEINVLAEQRTELLTYNDKKQLFDL
jgi:hypothetical protein